MDRPTKRVTQSPVYTTKNWEKRMVKTPQHQSRVVGQEKWWPGNNICKMISDQPPDRLRNRQTRLYLLLKANYNLNCCRHREKETDRQTNRQTDRHGPPKYCKQGRHPANSWEKFSWIFLSLLEFEVFEKRVTDGPTGGWTHAWADGPTNGQTDPRMDRWTDRQSLL